MKEINIVTRWMESNLDPLECRTNHCTTATGWFYYLCELYSRFINGENVETVVPQ